LHAVAKETSSGNSSLPLHEVLEAEFVALHGELPRDYPPSTEPNARLKAILGGRSWAEGETRRALHFRRRHSQRNVWTRRFTRGWRAAACSAGFIILQFIRDVLKRHLEVEAPDWLSGLLAANS